MPIQRSRILCTLSPYASYGKLNGGRCSAMLLFGHRECTICGRCGRDKVFIGMFEFLYTSSSTDRVIVASMAGYASNQN